MRFWIVISIALAAGAAVHGVRWYKARERRRLEKLLERDYAPPAPTGDCQ